ncbi:MAG: RNA polymerase sigma factor [Planctomycetota bacterium]|jgi:RNA polymerase sigma factor (sigma-70 family)
MVQVPNDDRRDPSDERLVERAQRGDEASLVALIERYQGWVYNVARRMVFSPQDAEDVAQEVMIKVVTRLSTFQGRSLFRTWLYRVTTNHVLTMRARGAEQRSVSFEQYAARINACPDALPPSSDEFGVDAGVLVDEAKQLCLMGMLQCLNRDQRIAFVLGALLGFEDVEASEVLEISREAYRKRLSRARASMRDFMDAQCGLAHDDAPCRCANKTSAYVRVSVVKPGEIRFSESSSPTLRESVASKAPEVERWIRAFHEQPMYRSPALAHATIDAIERIRPADK